MKTLICPKCKSNDISVQVVSDTHTKTKKRGLLYWVSFWWFVEFIIWFLAAIPMLIGKLLRGKKIVTDFKKFAVCQNCGYKWKV